MRKFPTGEAAESLEEMQKLLDTPDVTVTYDEVQRQMVICALAKLAVEHPGWLGALQEVALKMDNDVAGFPQMFATLHAMYLAEKVVSQ